MQSIEEILNKSAELIAQKEFQKAVALLEKANVFEPDNKEVLKNLGLCYVNLGEFTQGASVFEKLTKMDKDDATSWFYLGNCQEKTGSDELAAQSYARVIDIRGEFWDSYKSLSVLLLKQGMFEEVVSTLTKVLAVNEQDYQFYYLIATAYMSLGKHKEATQNLLKALALSPGHLQLLNNLGSCYLSQKQWKLAEETLQKAYDTNPENPITNYNLGTLYQLLGEYKKAMGYFSTSYNAEPTAIALSTLAYCAIQANEYETAASLYKSLTSLHPEKQVYQKNLMSALMKLGNIEEALKIAKKLVDLNPKSTELTKQLAQLYRLNNQPHQAVDILMSFIKRGKVDAEIYNEHALASALLEDWESAKNSYRKVIQLTPNNAQAHRDLALLYLNLNLADWAEDEMQTALRLKGDDPEILIGYATYLHKTQDFEKADEYYRKAIEKEPNDAEYHLCHGINFLSQNKPEEAVKSLERALEADQKCEDTKHYLAKAYYSLKKHKKAKDILEKLVTMPYIYDVETANLLALVYMELKEWKKAKDIFKIIMEKFPKNHLVLANAAKCALKLEEFEEAKDLARRSLEIFQDFEDALKILKKAEKYD